MNEQNKTKEELIKELQELQQKNISLETLYNKDLTERKHVEDMLRESEEKFRYMFENSVHGKSITQLSGKLKVNKATCDMFGYSRDEFQSLTWQDITHPDDVELTQNGINQLLSGEKDWVRLEKRYIHKNGSIIWVDLCSVLRRDKTGNPLYLMTSLNNITEQKRTENELAQKNEILLKLKQFSIDLSMLSLEDNLEAFIVKQLKKITGAEFAIFSGYNPEDRTTTTKQIEMEPGLFNKMVGLLGKPINKIHSVVSEEMYREMTEDIIGVRKTLHEISFGSISRPVGAAIQSFLNVDRFIALVYMVEGKLYGTSVLAMKKGKPDLQREILENLAFMIAGSIRRRKAEEELQRNEEKYRTLADYSIQGILIIQGDRTIYANPAFCGITGFSMEESLAMTNARRSELIHPEDRSRISERQARFERGKPISDLEEVRIISKDGQVHWVLSSIKPLTLGGKPAQMSMLIDITERKQAEEALKESRQRLYEAQKLAHIGVWDWNAENDSVIWSDELYKIAGRNQKLPAPTFAEQSTIYTPKSWHILKNAVENAMKTFDEFQLELDLIRPDGRIRNVNAFGGVKFDSNGQIAGLFGTLQDVTEHKLSESIFREIIEKNPISIQILNMEGYAIQINPAHTKLFGVHPPSDYSIFKDTQLLHQGLGELFEKIKNGEIVYFPDSYFNVKDVDPSFPDSPVWIKAIGFSLNNNNGIPDRIVIMHENITDRRQAEALLNDIIDKNPMSIQIVDKDGFTIRGNPAYIQLFGTLPPADFSIFDDLERKSPEMENLILRAKNGEIVHLPDIYFNAHDVVSEAPDIPLWIRALIFPLNDSGGKPERFVFMHENITERKNSEYELIKAKEHAEESDRLKSAFLANMSHEIRTPMNGILGFAELLKEPGLTGEEQQKYLHIIEKGGARMLNIINDIVSISKIESGLVEVKIEKTDINEQIEFIYTFFKPEVENKGLQLFVRDSLPAKEAIVKTDREKLYAILTNLVKNAIKYTDKGTIEFGYNMVATQHAATSASLQFYVKDTGIGIPKERQEAIFERFIQADIIDLQARQGAGLGLAIAKYYVEVLDGRIWVESEPGKGSTFYFTLPYNTEQEEKNVITNVIPAESAANLIRKLKILIAEDDEASEMLISIGLKTIIREMLKVTTGADAVEACRDNPDIDLVLMDIQMPVMNGYEATRQLRQFNKEVIIIAQTAFGLSGDREKAIDAGCNDYIKKPIERGELLALIQRYFKK